MEELVVPQRLGDAVGEVEAGHLLVPDLRVQADHLGVLELGDEGQGVPDGGQQDVTARLVGLGLDREAHRVALGPHVVAHEVERLDHAVERRPDVLASPVLGALAATPHHERLGPEAGREVDVAQHLGRGVAADLAAVGGEAALLEDRGAEEVGGDHLATQARVGQRLAEPVERGLAGRVVGDQVVVVEGDGGGSDLGEPVGGLHRVQWRTAGGAEHVDAFPAHGPQPERELVLGAGGVAVGCVDHGAVSCHWRVSELASTAASTRWTCRPSANVGVGSVPSAMARTRSTTWWVKLCS